MEKKERCADQCAKLIRLLDRDVDEISYGLKGELLDAYRMLLTEERSILTSMLRSIQNNY